MMTQPLINITRRQALNFAFFLVLYEFLTYVANDMIMPGMISVVESFHGPQSAIASSLTLYILGGASLQLFLGPISDCYGRRPVMIAGAFIFFACTCFIASSTSIHQFLLARFFQGMGLCFIAVIGYATLQEIFAEMDAIRLIALMANMATLAPLLGPVLGAIFISYFSWRLIFVLIGFFALIALWGLWKYMPEPVGQVKTDGSEIKKISLAPKVVMSNYKSLITNPPFMLASIALGLIGLPCVAWIALAPIIIVKVAHLSLVQYGLLQFPVFSASILGNWILQFITRHVSLKMIILTSSLIIGISLLFVFILPFFKGNAVIWLMPGLIAYFFGLGVVVAPLSRFVLFSTPIAKGTTSALMSMITMCIQAIGIEGANFLYQTHDNSLFGLFCAIVGGTYFLILGAAFYYQSYYYHHVDQSSQ